MQIKANEGTNLTNYSDIPRECNSFYSDLYTTKSTKITEHLERTFFGYEEHKLNEMNKKKCEGLLTEKECLEAVKSMESGKLPGTNGLPAEFCKVFWKDVSPFLIGSLNRSYQKGKVAITSGEGYHFFDPEKRQSIKRIEELKAYNPT